MVEFLADVSVTMLMEMSAALRKKSELQGAGSEISLYDSIIFATAQTLGSYPDLNAQVEGDSLRRHSDINIGFTLGTDRGLYLPVILHADRLSIEDIAAETERLAAKVEGKQVTEEDLSGGTFTVSNLGMFGVESFPASIVPPQSAILSLGAMGVRVAWGKGGALAGQPCIAATLTVDHRAVDARMAAEFLRDLNAQLGAL